MQYVFHTEKLKRYQFPTHTNGLVFDRSDATSSEAFIVVLEPNQAPPFHKHDDTEQVYYVLEGRGTLTIDCPGIEHPVEMGDVVVVPPSTMHSIKAHEPGMRHLAIDCFSSERQRAEPTWDEHVKAVCLEQGWDYVDVVKDQDVPRASD